MPKVVIADDEEFVRYFLRSVLDSIYFDVIAEVEKGDELYEVMLEQQPDILFLDINMPNMTGVEFLRQYAEKFPKTCIIILTSAALMNFVGEASLAGAKCFLRKDTPVAKMVEAIQKTWLEFKKENR